MMYVQHHNRKFDVVAGIKYESFMMNYERC